MTRQYILWVLWTRWTLSQSLSSASAAQEQPQTIHGQTGPRLWPSTFSLTKAGSQLDLAVICRLLPYLKPQRSVVKKMWWMFNFFSSLNLKNALKIFRIMEQKRNSTLKTIMCSYEKLQSGKREFLGSTLFRTPCFPCRAHGFDPLLGNQGPTSCATWSEKKKRKGKL